MKSILSIALLAVLVVGCQDDEKVFKGSGSNETKPATTLLQGGEGAIDSSSKAATPSAHVTFDLAVYGNSGAKLCDGEVKIVIMSDFTMDFPNSKAQCVSMTVDLSKAMGGGAAQGKKDGNIAFEDGMLLFKEIAGGTFDPPRPFLLGPIVQDSSQYKNFKKTTTHTVTTASGTSGSGSFEIEVLDVDTTYKNKYLDKPFNKILHWKIRSSGFEGVKKSEGLLFKEMEWAWNTNPIMIPKVTIRGELADLIESDGSGADLVGEIKIDLSVREYDFTGGGG
jgi:hypothetical protein